MFIDSMQFMNSGIDKLVKNLPHENFKYLVEEFGSENLELLKQKGAYPYEYMISFERFNEEKLPARKYFLVQKKKTWKIGDNGKVSDGHISIKYYLTCDMGDYQDHFLKKWCIVISWCFWKLYWYMFEILWIRSLPLF